MTKLAGVLFRKWILDNDFQDKCWIVNMVHDEIVVECHKSISKLASTALQEAMEKAGSIFVNDIPMPAQPVISSQWEH
jgi:DNA polymerase I-like protein with 3'-5' exonuclease and polymerase domains